MATVSAQAIARPTVADRWAAVRAGMIRHERTESILWRLATILAEHPEAARHCPTCGVEPGAQCVTPKGRRVSQAHRARLIGA